MPPPYQRVGLLLCLIALFVPAPAWAGDFELDSHTCSGSASGNASGGASNWLNGVAFTGSADVPTDATSVTLQSSIPKKTSPANASAQLQNCTMTYNFTWHPASGQTLETDPPPNTAIVKLSIGYNAGYWVATDGNGTVSGGAALTASGQVNGQDFGTNNPVNVGNSGNQSGLYATVSWSTGSGGATSYDTLTPVPAGGVITVTVPITMTTSASLSGDKCNSTDSATATVTPTVSVTPVILSLAGTTGYTDEGGYHTLNILVGQGCAGAVSAGSYSVSNYSWTVPGTIFKSFTASDAGDTVTPVTTQDLQTASPAWVWELGNAATGLAVTVSASFTLSDGATQLGPCAAHADLLVWTPTTTQHDSNPGQV